MKRHPIVTKTLNDLDTINLRPFPAAASDLPDWSRLTNRMRKLPAATMAQRIVNRIDGRLRMALKFLGLGIMLGAITMALGLIAATLRNLGSDVMSGWPSRLNPGTPPKPRSAKML